MKEDRDNYISIVIVGYNSESPWFVWHDAWIFKSKWRCCFCKSFI